VDTQRGATAGGCPGQAWITNPGLQFLSRYYLFSLGFFILALMSKPMAVTLPAVLLIVDWYPFQRIRSARTFWTAVVEKWPFIALSFLSSVMTILAQKAVGAVAPIEFVPVATRVLVAVKSLVTYLVKMVMPLNLIPFYPYPTHISRLSPEYVFPIVVVIGLTTLCMMYAKEHKLLLSVWGYYCVSLIPVLGIIQVGNQSMADRYTYLPSLGPFLMIGLAAAWVFERVSGFMLVKRTYVAAMVLVLTAITLLTIQQIGIWENSFSLWNYVIEKEPDAFLAYNSRGVAFNRIGEVDKAYRDFDKAIALNPSYYEAYFNRGIIFEKIGQLDRALREYDRAIGLNPLFYEAYFNRGMVFEKKGQTDRAIQDFKQTVMLHPSYYEAYSNLGALYGAEGMQEKALDYFNRAILLNPDRPTGYLNRGMFYLGSGNKEIALADFRKACYLGDEGGCNAFNDLRREVAGWGK
jgi:Tfp pilus assembly protein PilF